MSKLSIIIPTLNEEKFLDAQQETLKSFAAQGHEVIVVDGGSTDKSLEIANSINCKVFTLHPSRGQQLHFGARQSTREILLFLHADTILPPGAVTSINNAFVPALHCWGRFDISFSSPRPIFRMIAWFMNRRSCLTGIVTGDQAMFVKRECYFSCGGFPDYPIMEDVAISKRLRKITPPVCLSDKVVSSSRKWETQGIFKTILTMWGLRLLFFLGTSTDRLARLYQAK